MLRKLSDNSNPDSLANSLRRRRFGVFLDFLAKTPSPPRILDIGGTASFWQTMGYVPPPGGEVVILNLTADEVSQPGFTSVAGDARDLGEFDDGSFDVVFSNSVIEHVGTYDDQRKMANEVRRVGQRYFVQTPNKWFPIEPHFLFPCFQFLPVEVRARLLQARSLGWVHREPAIENARSVVASVRLLEERELSELFPGATIVREKFWGLTKSITAVSTV